MSATKIGFLLAFAGMLGGCGLVVPEIQEFPNPPIEGQLFVQAIARNVTCEVRDAIAYVYYEDALIDPNLSNLAFLEGWGVQITLTLNIDEKGSLNPTVNWFPPSPATAIFNLAAGGTLSSQATRIEKLNAYYTVKELRKLGFCVPRPNGPFLLESDLKLREWLKDTIMVGATRVVTHPTDIASSGPFKQNVLSHEVKFEVVTSGNVTPSWKLERVLINPTGTFLSANRTRTHDLILTFGPAEEAMVRGRRIPQPSQAAASAALASEIGVAVSNGIRNTLQP